MIKHDTKNVVIAKITIWAAIFIIVFDMVNQFSLALFGDPYFGFLINGLSWIILISLFYWISCYPKKYVLLKILIAVTVVKFGYYSLVFHQYQFQKGILIVPLLVIMLFYNEKFRKLTYKLIEKYKNYLLILLLLTFIPFFGVSSYQSSIYRFSALWAYPQCVAYYLLAFMIIIGKRNFFISSIFLLLIITTGARSGIMPAFLYITYVFIINIKRSLSVRRKAAFSVFFGLILLVGLFIHPDLKLFREGLDYNLTPLFTENITDRGYGSGRGTLHMVLFEEIGNFDTFEFFFGRSASSMYHLYESTIGVRNWPHDDFATVLYVYGIIGLLLYLYYLFIVPLRSFSKNGLPKTRIILLATLIFMMALTNGFYTYPSSYLFILIYGVLYEESRRSCSYL